MSLATQPSKTTLLELPDYNDHRSDQELIAAANEGDAEAFEALYFRYRDWVVNLACRFTGDNDLAFDVLQETFIYFLKKFPGFELRCQLKTFLYPAVRNLALAARQKAERSQGDPAHLTELPDQGSEIESGSTEALMAVLNSLPEFQREVLLLRFANDLSLPEIAEALQIPVGTVKSRLHNGLDALRRDPRTKDFFGA
ncbi:MAG: sigma-70 family RNA polymerase sigma factor [Verrucomicrobiota bacterium]|jgi:RNA polymerase sigma-70 factor, ECF subfamily